ncbi:hypothetical protein [Sphingobacterium hungaricum]|uniref:Uncharacterized protein n=1 Tax=Sphingobacterium hungaricum TaxID=2082723 RepID=A0A928V1V7_9SPHI|nr:hypothetical protein [Sphingobacterium hungaricum]MBE8715119.1 hypothetical protein [Sphingobacterium hungaricum]
MLSIHNSKLILLFVLCTFFQPDTSVAYAQDSRAYQVDRDSDFGRTFQSSDLTEVKFFEIYGAMATTGLMYEKFGKWDQADLVQKKYPLFTWTFVKLFEHSDEKFTVYTYGMETEDDYYSSIFIENMDGEDMLGDESYRDEFIDLFDGKLDKETDNDQFFEEYWRFSNPKRYKELYGE